MDTASTPILNPTPSSAMNPGPTSQDLQPQPAPAPSPAGTPPTVLVVEDDDFIGELYARSLTKAGFRIQVARNGNDALKLILTGAFRVILLDLMIPGASGMEILGQLHRGDGTRLISSKILITTNMDQSEMVRKKLEDLADGYLIKAEITPRELVGYVNALLRS
jgi:DNA-binding response OmpR family regulator